MTLKRDTSVMVNFRSGLTLLAALALSGCISLSAKPPESLLTLTPSASAAAGRVTSGSSGSAIRILEPETPAKLGVPRVPVQVDPTEIAYLKDAVWVERPARLFRSLLAETLRARTGRLIIDGDETGFSAATQLRGTLREFGYDAANSSAVVRFDAVRSDASGTVETRRFESIQPGVTAEAGPVGAALNRGANDVAGQIAEWMVPE